jgi:hypothetical protein
MRNVTHTGIITMSQVKHYPNAAARQRAYRERQAQARRVEQEAKGLPPAPPIATLPGRARWQALIEQARLALETARDEMQSYWDDRSEAWQEGERGEAMQGRIEALAQTIDGLADLSW